MTKSTMTDYRQKLEEVGMDNENEESMDEENSIRYFRMNSMYTMTECQVQIENYMLLRKLSRDDRKPKGIIPNINKIRHTTAESSQPKVIRIVIGIKDQYMAEWP
jgi:competence protein ComGF